MSAVAEPITPPVISLTRSLGLSGLVNEMTRGCAMPVGTLQVAALLETTGITDAIARRRYGFSDVFALAEALADRLPGAAPSRFEAAKEGALASQRSELLRDISRGPLALLPMVLLSLIIALYQGIGKWPPGHVLALSMAMVGSLLVTSGFVQAASRKGASYLCQGYVNAARRIVSMILGAGLLAVCVSAVLLAWIAPQVMSTEAAAILAVAFWTLSVLWLAAGVLFLVGSVYSFGFALTVGVMLSYGTILRLAPVVGNRSMLIFVAAAIGFGSALLVMALAAWRAFTRQAELSKVNNEKVVLPPWPHLAVGLAPYFVYGLAYVGLILAGHVICWMAVLPAGTPRIVAVTATEAGLTLALMGYILAGGVAEHTIGRFWRMIQTFQRQVTPGQASKFRAAVRDFFFREQAQFAVALLLCNCLVVVLLAGILHWRLLPWSSWTTTVFALGLCGYGLIGLGVFDCMFMVTLSRPSMATRSLALGIIATLITGLVLGRNVGYAWTALAVVAGGLVFLISAHWQLHRMLEQMDYCYYASF